MLILLFAQRTTFCADLERMPSGELKFTRRWLLEVPFDLIAAVMYVFVYFNLKRGRTRISAGIYHFVVLLENSGMAVFIFLYDRLSSSSGLVLASSHFQLVSLVGIIGLYLAGIFFMVTFYLIYHPTKTQCCFWIGIPRKCCPCIPFEGDKDNNDENDEENVTDGNGRRGEITSSREGRGEEAAGRNTDLQVHVSRMSRNGGDLRSQIGNSSITISQPTLVSHNGFVPRNLLPVGSREAEMAAASSTLGLGLSGESSIIQGAPSFQTITKPRGRVSKEDRVSEMSTFPIPPGVAGSSGAREDLERGDRGGSYKDRGSNMARRSTAGGSTSTAHASDLASSVFISPHSSHSRILSSSNNTTGRTASESNVFLDTPASENDTELTYNLNCIQDTVIDSPLTETTNVTRSDVHQPGKSMRIDSTDQEGKDVDSQKSCTDDTGIDVDSDNQLTQGTLGDMDDIIERGNDNDGNGYNFEGEPTTTRLPVFTDVPATACNNKGQLSTSSHWKTNLIAAGSGKGDSSSPEPLPPPPMFQDQVHEHSRDSVTPTLPTPTYSSSSIDLTPSTQRRQANLKETTTATGDSKSDSQGSPDRHKLVAPRSPIGARAHQVGGTEKLDRAGSLPGHATRVPSEGMGGSSSVAPSSHNAAESAPKTPRSPKGARRLQVQKQPSTSPVSNPQLRNVANSLELGKRASNPSVPPPPVPPKDVPIRRNQNGLTRGLTNLVSPPADRAQSSSPMPVRSHDPRGSSTGPPGVGIHRTDGHDPRISGKIGGVSNYSREKSKSSHHLSNSQRHQPHSRPPPQGRSQRVESWHESKAGALTREKRMSASSGLASNHGRQIPTSTLTGQHHPADRRSFVSLHGNSNLQSRPTPPRGTPRSISSPGRGSGPPRLTKQGMGASSFKHQHNSPYIYPAYSHSPKYPRHPQGALGNNNNPSNSASPQYKRPLSMPSHRPSIVSNTSDSIDEPLNLHSSAARSSASGGSSTKGQVSGINSTQFPANPNDDEIYDKLEPEKPPAQVQIRTVAKPSMSPVSRSVKTVGHPQSRPLSYHPVFYVPTVNTHESAV